MKTSTIFGSILIIILIGAGVYFINKKTNFFSSLVSQEQQTASVGEQGEEETIPEDKTKTVIGTSAGGNEITAYHFGEGDTDLLFVGGIHGGYSWNTSLVAYELADYLSENPSVIPQNVRVTVVPVLNPDGLESVVGTTSRFNAADVTASEDEKVAGRFNGNGVDLNRNFDCDWQSVGTWQSRDVDGGDTAFSEPESAAIRNYIQADRPAAVVVWYSSAGGVFASNCHSGVLEETTELTNIFADASDYRAYKEFNFYEITGDMVNWLAKERIPAISVLLTNHEDVEWDKNRAGIDALLAHYAEVSSDTQ